MQPTPVQSFSASFAQQRLWLLEQYEPGTGTYNIPAAWRLNGHLDVLALQGAIQDLVQRHEVLRTTFAMEAETLVQRVAEDLRITLDVQELIKGDEAGWLRAQAQAPFDLEHGPLVRVALLRSAPHKHVLLLNMHHIVSDGWSMGVLARELQLLYGAFTQGQPSPLTELPIQYADYAMWQREWLQGAALQSQVDFWRKTLEGAPPLIDLPLARPRPAQLSHCGAFVPFELDATSTAALRKLCQQAQVTALMAMAALLKVLLHRYSRQDDICIGYPVAGRERKELEGLIGFFVNILVLRTRVDPRKSFLQLLAQVRESVLDADDHQDLPFEKLVKELKPERSLNHSPLFQVMLAYNNPTGEQLCLPGLEVMPEGFGETQIAKFYLTLELTKEEQAQLLAWNETSRHAELVCVHELFEKQAAAIPNATAVVCGPDSVTYGELNGSANRLARHLRSLGVGPDQLVGLCVQRGVAMVQAMLAVLKAGGAYVPLDPEYLAQRLTFMLQDCAAPVLVTQSTLCDRLPPHTAHTVLLDEHAQAISLHPDHNLEPLASPDHLAWCIYTSGSTGQPKGVLLEHASAASFLAWAASEFGVDDLSTTIASTSICFYLSVLEIFAPLSVGTTVILVKDALGVAELPAGIAATLLNTVPSAGTAEVIRDVLSSVIDSHRGQP